MAKISEYPAAETVESTDLLPVSTSDGLKKLEIGKLLEQQGSGGSAELPEWTAFFNNENIKFMKPGYGTMWENYMPNDWKELLIFIFISKGVENSMVIPLRIDRLEFNWTNRAWYVSRYLSEVTHVSAKVVYKPETVQLDIEPNWDFGKINGYTIDPASDVEFIFYWR